MIGQQYIAREAEVLRILGLLRGRIEWFTLIGGYAVDAYSALPRYSVDCDLVVASKDRASILPWLSQEGYQKEDEYQNELEGVETQKLIKRINGGVVSVDLMIGGLRCRQTEAVWKEEEVRQTSTELRVAGVNGSVLSRVASKELLIALKLHSGRDPDMRDVVMLADRAEWSQVGELSIRGVKSKVISQLEEDICIISDAEFEQRLKAYFGLKTGGQRRISGALNEVRHLLEAIRDRKFPS
jgi:hypothetical protein